MRARVPRSQIDAPQGAERDPVGTLLDFLLALKRFREGWGPRPPEEDFDRTVTRVRGYQPALDGLRSRRRRHP